MVASGVAAGVPYVLRPPSVPRPDAPVVIGWHLLDAPRTPEAFAAALPLSDLDAWRVYLGLPMSGARSPSVDEITRRLRTDPITEIHDPINAQAVAEFPHAWQAIATTHALGDGPIGLLGGSAGAAVAGGVLLSGAVTAAAAVLVSPLLQLRPIVPLLEKISGRPYTWSPAAHRAADRMDLVARAAELPDVPVLLVLGEDDDLEAFRRPAGELEAALAGADRVEVTGMAHSLAEEPGVVAAPPSAQAIEVDRLASAWFDRHLGVAASA